jgi:hypothetical protein
MNYPSKPSKTAPSIKSDMTRSLPVSLMEKYPFVKPEVWETPMNPTEFDKFVAALEETRLKLKES